MTSRDNISLDSLYPVKGDRLTRTTDLRRAFIAIDRIELKGNELIWANAQPRRVEGKVVGVDGKPLMDGRIGRRWIRRRYEAEAEGHSIVDEFLKLQSADGPKILEFAKRWGVLDLCWHGVPRHHDSLDGFPMKLPPKLATQPKELASRVAPRGCLSCGREPLETWRFFSRQARRTPAYYRSAQWIPPN